MRLFNLHFAHPLWLLAGAAAVVALLLLSVNRGTRLDTAYLDLWEKALAQTPLSERLIQRMANLMLVLLASACLLAAAAAAGPSRDIPGPRDVVFVLDRSATMAASSSGESRLDEGKRWIERQIGALADFDRAGLAVAGLDAELFVKPTTDRAELLRALASVAIEPAHSDLTSATMLDFGPMETSSPGKGSHLTVETILVTDGAGGKKTFAKTKFVGAPAENCGLVELRVDDPFPEHEAELHLTISNATATEQKRRVAVKQGDRETAGADVKIPPRTTTLTTVKVPRGRGGAGTVSLTPSDAFELDDHATFLLTSPASASLVLVKTEDGPSHAFEAAAHALAHEFDVNIGEASRAGDWPPGAVVLQEGGSLADLPDRALLLGVSAPGLAVDSGLRAAPSAVLSYRGDHALLRGLRLDRLFTRRQVTFEGHDDELARAEDGVVIALSKVDAASTQDKRRILALSFTLDNSNFVSLDGGFPVFLRRAFLWLSGGEKDVLGATRSGDDPNGPLVGRPIRGPRHLGAWTMPSQVETTASLLDAATTDVTPKAPAKDPVLAVGAPSSDALGFLFAWASAAVFAGALLLELATQFRESGVALPRRARAV